MNVLGVCRGATVTAIPGRQQSCLAKFFLTELWLPCVQSLGNTLESSLAPGTSPLEADYICCRACCIISRAALDSLRTRFYSSRWKRSFVLFCFLCFTLR